MLQKINRTSRNKTGIPANEDAASVTTSPKAVSPKTVSSKSMSWTQDPEGVQRNILEAARIEFSEKGLSGARVDEIAARISTSKRMIFYYFKDKQGLYIAVLEEAYARIRAIERNLDLAQIPPLEALATLTGLTFDHHANNPDFVRLVMVENIHHARHLKISAKISELNLSAIRVVEEIYRRGVIADVFRSGLKSIDIHLTISALCFYNVSNQATILEVFGHDMADFEARQRRRANVIETVLCSVRK